MDLNTIWETFLKRIELTLAPVLYTTWFKDTKLVKLKDNTKEVVSKRNVTKIMKILKERGSLR